MGMIENSRKLTEEHGDVELVLVVDAPAQQDEVERVEQRAAQRPQRPHRHVRLDRAVRHAHQHHAPDTASANRNSGVIHEATWRFRKKRNRQCCVPRFTARGSPHEDSDELGEREAVGGAGRENG